MQKGIKITKENQKSLMSKFSKDDAEELFPIGYWLIADFGDDETFDTLTEDTFNELFVIAGEILNGFSAIQRR